MREPPASVDSDALRATRTTAPGAVELAQLLSFVRRIERGLLRAVRLHVTPHLDVGDEADLWWSPLADVRGLDGLAVRPGVNEILRSEARQRWEGADAPFRARLIRARALAQAYHRGSPPLVALEEDIGWLDVTQGEPGQQMDELLRVPLAALVSEQRTGVARWAARALPAMPAQARSTAAAWQLQQAAGSFLPTAPRLGLPAPSLQAAHVSDIAPLIDTAPLGIRRIGDRLELGAVGPGGQAVQVPATEPRVIDLVVQGRETTSVQVSSGQRAEVEVGWHPIDLVAGNGMRWRLHVLPDDEEERLRDALVQVHSSDNPTSRWVGLAIAEDLVLTQVFRLDLSRQFTVIRDGTALTGRLVASMPADNLVLGALRVPQPGFARPVRPVDMASEAQPGARAVSLGLDDDLRWKPVIGTVHIGKQGGISVEARTELKAAFCAGLPVLSDNGLIGLVSSAHSAKEDPSATTLDLAMDIERLVTRVRLMRRPVDIRVPGRGGDDLRKTLLDSPTLRELSENERPFASVVDRGQLFVLDSAERDLRVNGEPNDAAGRERVVDLLETLARGQRLVELPSGEGDEELTAPVTISFALVVDGRRVGLEQRGGRVPTGSSLSLLIENPGAETVYCWVFDVGISGQISLVTSGFPDGLPLQPGRAVPVWGDRGGSVFWPAEVPAWNGPPTFQGHVTARQEHLVLILADRPQQYADLGAATQVTRGVARSTLDLVFQEVRSGSRDVAFGRAEPLRYRVEVIQFDLVPPDDVPSSSSSAS